MKRTLAVLAACVAVALSAGAADAPAFFWNGPFAMCGDHMPWFRETVELVQDYKSQGIERPKYVDEAFYRAFVDVMSCMADQGGTCGVIGEVVLELVLVLELEHGLDDDTARAVVNCLRHGQPTEP